MLWTAYVGLLYSTFTKEPLNLKLSLIVKSRIYIYEYIRVFTINGYPLNQLVRTRSYKFTYTTYKHKQEDVKLFVICIDTLSILKVIMRFDTFLYFRQFVLNKILAPDVFDYGDSKSESWHSAKNSRSISGQQIASRTFLRNWKSCLIWPAL